MKTTIKETDLIYSVINTASSIAGYVLTIYFLNKNKKG